MSNDAVDVDPVIKQLERDWSERAKHPIFLHQLVESWDGFTREVETGYRAGIYDYANDLSRRDMIAEAMERSAVTAAKIAPRVSESDQRLRAATVPDESPILSFSRPPTEWWWYRRPVRMGWELAEDFERERRYKRG